MTRDQTAVVIDRTTLEREVDRLVGAAAAAGAPIRVLGSIGVALHCPDARSLLPTFERTYADIDFAAYRRDARAIAATVTALGYVEARDVFITSEGHRAIFKNPVSRIHLDVFYDRLEFCHVIPLAGRLEADLPTLPLAELLLSKLQIVKLNEKDVVDTILLLLDHPLGAGDDDTIDIGRIAALCAEEWGLWRTLTMNLEKVAALAASYAQLADDQRARVRAAVVELKRRIDDVPKPFAWRMRHRVGDRRKWWTDVDEIR
ncbi:MAG TPA: hypothetical protein VLS28_09550 [Candidatus Sulfomarinibacteraceae bacterium]|nr:hypothetical protein [Candidatus Sulfomarinibacteraceae bacterium]